MTKTRCNHVVAATGDPRTYIIDGRYILVFRDLGAWELWFDGAGWLARAVEPNGERGEWQDALEIA